MSISDTHNGFEEIEKNEDLTFARLALALANAYQSV